MIKNHKKDIPKQLRNSASQRTSDFLAKLKTAQDEIAKELLINNGIYPNSKRKLSVAEICRRAGVSKDTLQSKKHVKTTRIELKIWLKSISEGSVSGPKEIKKIISTRADEWKEAHAKLADSYNICQLELTSVRKINKELEDRITELNILINKLQNVTYLNEKH